MSSRRQATIILPALTLPVTVIGEDSLVTVGFLPPSLNTHNSSSGKVITLSPGQWEPGENTDVVYSTSIKGLESDNCMVLL